MDALALKTDHLNATRLASAPQRSEEDLNGAPNAFKAFLYVYKSYNSRLCRYLGVENGSVV